MLTYNKIINDLRMELKKYCDGNQLAQIGQNIHH